MSVFNEIVGTSPASWEDAALNAVKMAEESGGTLRVAQVMEQDLDLAGDAVLFRTRLSISFKYQTD